MAGLGETPRRVIRKRYRYSPLEKFEDCFDTQLDLLRTKTTGCGRAIFGHFSNMDICRTEAAGHVISDMALEYVVTDVPVSFGNSRLNSGRIIRLFVQPDPYCALLRSIQ